MRRTARIELVEADIDWSHDVKPAKSQRPHYLRIKAANGAIVATTETYLNLTNARRAAESLVQVCKGVSEIREVQGHG